MPAKKVAASKKAGSGAAQARGEPISAGPFPEVVEPLKPTTKKPEVRISDYFRDDSLSTRPLASPRQEFVARLLSLLALERDAEIAEAKALHEKSTPEAAQRRGQSLLNLR